MRHVTSIKLEQLIIHMLDTKGSNGLVLSECTIPLEGNNNLVDYIVGHIQHSLKDPSSKAASFVAMDSGITSGICKDLLQDRLSLVDGSCKLAQKLYTIIENDKRINACDLVVCLYQAENKNGTSRYLALLNIEPAAVFRHKQERDPQGRLYINFEIDTEAMPTLGEKLQKCAFVRQLEPQSEYDMMLLDRQKQGKEVAKFFINEFMGATLAFDSRQRTINLYKGLINARNKIFKELKPDEIEYLDQATQVVIRSESFNIDTWVNSLSLSDEHKQKIEQELSTNLPDCEFEIDKSYVEKLVQKRTFKGEGGLKITVKADKFDKIIKSIKRIPEEGEPFYYRIEIQTDEWKEVPR